MNKNQDKIKQALECIESSLQAINTDKDWLKFLQFQSQFYNYFFGNIMFIYAQNPEATFVKGYKAWNKLGRYVKKGSKGLAIAPCYKKKRNLKSRRISLFIRLPKAKKKLKKLFRVFV